MAATALVESARATISNELRAADGQRSGIAQRISPVACRVETRIERAATADVLTIADGERTVAQRIVSVGGAVGGAGGSEVERACDNIAATGLIENAIAEETDVLCIQDCEGGAIAEIVGSRGGNGSIV